MSKAGDRHRARQAEKAYRKKDTGRAKRLEERYLEKTGGRCAVAVPTAVLAVLAAAGTWRGVA